MGVRASVTLIDQACYEAGIRGDFEQMVMIEDPGRISLGKAWHAINYLILGSNDLTLLSGGTQLECVTEHCEAHSPDSIKSLHEIVSRRTAADFVSGMNVREFDRCDIYPAPWNSDAADYVTEHLENFLTQLDHAVRMECGFLIVII